MKTFYVQVAVGCLILEPLAMSRVVAAEGERRQLDAHEHGVTMLNIALDENELTAELEGPGMNFVGFEHPPRTPEQKQAVNDALAVLESGESLIRLSPKAQCVLVSAGAQHVSETDEHDDHDEDHADEFKESRHSEFIAEYRYRCGNPDELGEITVGLFERFPLTTEIEVSFIGPGVTAFDALTPAESTLKLRR